MSIAVLNSFRFRLAGFEWMRSFILLLVFAFREMPSATPMGKDTGPQKTALVELFTSEGCSSCPAADELLPELRQPNVFVLEFHVDYWDRLGWKDPFSDAAFSARQRGYARRFRLSSLYTPQTVINGRSEKVGSDRTAIGNAIAGELGDGTQHDQASLQLSAREKNGSITVTYTALDENATGKKEPEIVMLALVQQNAVSKIGAGENRGRTLKHVNIVRGLKTGETGKGIVRFDIPAGMKSSELSITGWIEASGNGGVSTVMTTGLLP